MGGTAEITFTGYDQTNNIDGEESSERLCVRQFVPLPGEDADLLYTSNMYNTILEHTIRQSQCTITI